MTLFKVDISKIVSVKCLLIWWRKARSCLSESARLPGYPGDTALAGVPCRQQQGCFVPTFWSVLGLTCEQGAVTLIPTHFNTGISDILEMKQKALCEVSSGMSGFDREPNADKTSRFCDQYNNISVTTLVPGPAPLGLPLPALLLAAACSRLLLQTEKCRLLICFWKRTCTHILPPQWRPGRRRPTHLCLLRLVRSSASEAVQAACGTKGNCSFTFHTFVAQVGGRLRLLGKSMTDPLK